MLLVLLVKVLVVGVGMVLALVLTRVVLLVLMPPTSGVSTALQRHSQSIEVVGDGRLLHYLQPGVADQVVQAVVEQHCSLLRDDLVSHSEL